MYRLIIVALILLCTTFQILAMQPDKIDNLSLEEIELINFENNSIAAFRSFFTYGQSLSNSLNDTIALRGEILLMVLSDAFAADLKAEKLTTSDKEVRELIKDFEELKFSVYQPIIPDYVKLSYHLCEKNYSYIYTRMHTRGYFWPVIIFVSICGLWLFGQFSNRFVIIQNDRLKKWLLILMVLAVVLLLFFYITCSNCITPDMFYFIHL